MSYIFRRPAQIQQRRPFNPALFDEGGTATPSASDTATATETASLAVTLAASDTATASESASITATLSATDSASATDANAGIALAGVDDRVQAYEAAGGGLRFYGNTASNQDKLRIELDNPANPSVDVGAGDATWEFWIRCNYADNTSSGIADARYSNIVMDRDIWGHERGFVLGVTRQSGELRVCFAAADTGGGWATTYGTTNVGDGAPHHVALTWRQSTSTLEAYVDGASQGTRAISITDLSYPDGERPGSGANNEYLVFGGEKHGVGVAYNGYVSEIRVSDSRRYTSSFTRPSSRFTPDTNTMGLYHLNEQVGTVAYDWSGRSNGENGELLVGGTPSGPEWDEVRFPFGTQLDIAQTRTETGTATEGTPATALSATDSATASESSSLDTGNTPISSSDSGTATEGASAISASVSATDSGAATESNSVAASAATSDTATATDANAGIAVTGSGDTVTASESASIAATVSTTDSASAIEGTSAIALAGPGDTATATEGAVTISATLSATDSATASETSSIAATLSATDSATAAEGSSLNTGDNPSASDTFSFTESASIVVTLAASDTATATDAGSIAAALSASDSVTFNELATILALIAAVDTAAASESSSVQQSGGTTPSASDLFTFTESASIFVALAASDTITATEVGILFVPEIPKPRPVLYTWRVVDLGHGDAMLRRVRARGARVPKLQRR